MSSINNYRDTGPEDYLAAAERERKAKKAGNTAQSNIAISGLLTADTAVTTTTLAEVDPDTHEATTSATVTTLATCTTYTPPFKWYFTSTTPANPPLKYGFFSWVFSS